jgi:hypothetical protein
VGKSRSLPSKEYAEAIAGMRKKPYSLRIFLPGGDPDGLRIIEKSNWTGCGLVVPRALLSEARERKELGRTGVYLLTAAPEDSGLPRLYVGEGDPIRPRLEQHAAKRDFWTVCVAFTSKDDALNKAHVQYLESRLVSMAKEAKRCLLENGNEPLLPTLSEPDVADMEGFLEEVLLCCPLLGVNVFVSSRGQQPEGTRLKIEAKGICAFGYDLPEGFLVKAGSGVVADEVPSCPVSVRELRRALRGNGVIRSVGGDGGWEMAEDYTFSSPSMASAVVQGRSSNGRLDWKTKEGRSLREVQDQGA